MKMFKNNTKFIINYYAADANLKARQNTEYNSRQESSHVAMENSRQYLDRITNSTRHTLWCIITVNTQCITDSRLLYARNSKADKCQNYQ